VSHFPFCPLVPGRMPLAAIMLGFALTACTEDSTGLSGTPLGADQFGGHWTLQLTDTASCGNGTSPLSVALFIVPDQPDIFGFDLNPFFSTWSSGATAGWVSGFFPLRIPGGVLLTFTGGSPQNPTTPATKGFQFAGKLTAQLTLIGTITDPTSNQVPALGPGSCTYQVRGART
jgi:hypothetical protein